MRCLVLIGLLLLWGPPGATAADPLATVRAYLDALLAGDVEGMQAQLGGRLYQKRRVLLEANAEYPAFLKQWYDAATYRVHAHAEQTESPHRHAVDITLQFPQGHTQMTRLIVEKDPQGVWKIVEELPAPR